MNKIYILTVISLFSFLAASCGTPDRGIVDRKLALACEGAIRALSSLNDEIKVKKAEFKSEKSHDGLPVRVVTLNTNFIENHGMVVEKTYSCSYKEQTTLLGYHPEFYHLEKDGVKYGDFEGSVSGDVDGLIKITGELEKVFR